MASKRQVEAGRGYVEIGIRNRIARGAKGVQADLDKLGKNLSARGASLTKLGAVMTSASAGLLAMPIKAASDMQETMGKFQVVFGDAAASVEAWSDTTAAAMGVSERSMAQMLAGMQDLLVPMGMMPAEAEEVSKTLSTLAVDLASFNNMDSEKTFDDLTAALTGSGEVMKKYGVILTEAAVKQELLAMSLDPKTADDVAKAQARLNIIMRGTTVAQGDAIRTGGSFANQMKRVFASVEDVTAAIGGPLIEDFAKFLTIANGGIASLKGFVTENQELVRIVGLSVVAVGGAGVAVIGLGGSLYVAGLAMSGLAAGAALLASPLALAAAAAGGLGFALLRYTSIGSEALDFLRERFGGLLQTVQGTIGAIVSAIQSGNIDAAWEMTTQLMELVWLDLTSGMRDAWSGAMDFILDAGSTVAMQIGRIFQALSATFGTMLDSYKSYYDSVYNFTERKLSELGQSLTGVKTIGAPSEPKGSAFEQQFGGMEDSLRGVIEQVRGFGEAMESEAQGDIAGRMDDSEQARDDRQSRIDGLRSSLANAASQVPEPQTVRSDAGGDQLASMLAGMMEKPQAIDVTIPDIEMPEVEQQQEQRSGETGTFAAAAAGIIGSGQSMEQRKVNLAERTAKATELTAKAIADSVDGNAPAIQRDENGVVVPMMMPDAAPIERVERIGPRTVASDQSTVGVAGFQQATDASPLPAVAEQSEPGAVLAGLDRLIGRLSEAKDTQSSIVMATKPPGQLDFQTTAIESELQAESAAREMADNLSSVQSETTVGGPDEAANTFPNSAGLISKVAEKSLVSIDERAGILVRESKKATVPRFA